MSFTRLLSTAMRRSPSLQRERSSHPLRASFRPTFEALEARWVPSTLTVTNNHDSGAGSLRAEVTAAHSGDTIVFASSLDGQTITLTSGELLLKHNLTISGFTDRNVTISGNNASRVFELSSSSKPQVTLSGLTITNGYAHGSGLAACGGGILNQGTLTVSNCTLSGNLATQGGAIQNGSSGALTISGSSLIGNSVIPGDNDGGAILNYGTLTVSASTLSGNSAAAGSAISNIDGAATIKDGTSLSNNHGGAVCNLTGSLTIADSTLSGNSAVDGAGIVVMSGQVTVSGCTLTGNTATGFGGAISIEGDTSHSPVLIVSNCTLSGNSAGRQGGAICTSAYGTATISGCILTGNSAPNAGGAIYVGGGTVTLTNDKMSGNTTTGYGGGLYILSGATVYVDAFTVANIIDNTDSSGLNGPTANIDGSYSPP